MLLALLACGVGLVILTKASDEFVIGAARLSAILRVSPIVIGAVVVGFGTSAPEMFVSGLAALQGDQDLGVGNVIGSNIANVTLVLGAAAAICTLAMSSRVLRREAPLSVGACVLFGLQLPGGITRFEGVVLAVVLVGTLGYLLRNARRTADVEMVGEVREFLDGDEEFGVTPESVRTGLGLLGTLLSAQLLVWGAVRVAEEVGLSEAFIGLTLVALGTSLPELVTAVQAARRREHELVVGNLLGSNIFNSLAVGAIIGLVGPGPIADVDLVRIAVPVMLASVGLAWLFMVTRREVVRWEGAVLLGAYAVAVPVLAI